MWSEEICGLRPQPLITGLAQRSHRVSKRQVLPCNMSMLSLHCPICRNHSSPLYPSSMGGSRLDNHEHVIGAYLPQAMHVCHVCNPGSTRQCNMDAAALPCVCRCQSFGFLMPCSSVICRMLLGEKWYAVFGEIVACLDIALISHCPYRHPVGQSARLAARDG